MAGGIERPDAADAMELTALEAGWWGGTFQGQPIAIKQTRLGPHQSFVAGGPIESPTDRIAVIQVGLANGGRAGGQSIQWPAELSELVRQERIALKIEPGEAWMSILDGGLLGERLLPPLISKWITALRESNLTDLEERCTDCAAREVANIAILDERILRICPGCLAARRARTAELTHLESDDWIKLAVRGLGAAVLGAGIWCVVWWCFEKALDYFAANDAQQKYVIVPHFLTLVAVVALGWLLSIPAKNLIKNVKRRGRVAGARFAAAACVLAALLGEVLLIFVVFKQVTGQWSVGTTLRLVPHLWWTQGLHMTVFKLGGVLMAAVIAHSACKFRANAPLEGASA